MLNGDLPENTPKTKAGTKVKIPDEWKMGTPNYVETTKGEIVKKSVQIATVEAIAVGNGKTVPVPIGFYYVGGNLSSGVVISDNAADQLNGKYFGQEDVPSGLSVENGELKNEFVGNQFVWIPCELSEYKKCNVWDEKTQTNTTLANAWWDTTTGISEKVQIRKYGGFYVGRFEAGLASSIDEYEDIQSGNATIYNKEAVPQSKAGIIPWMFVDWLHSQKSAASMYNTATVNSGLITGAQWDVMINKIKSIKDESGDTKYALIDSGSWGNYYDEAITGYKGRYATYNASNNKMSTFSGVQTNATKNANSYTLLTTGASDKTRTYNIYDVAGNVWEWTEETSFYKGNSATQCRVFRGGGLMDESSKTACYRWCRNNEDSTGCDIGFRTVLYMK